MAYYQQAATKDGHIAAGHGIGSNVAIKTLTYHQNTPYTGLKVFKEA
jgi:hypothetical protein